MADVSKALADYLASLRKRRWQPGILDCGVFMADWALRVCGRDPIADVRGSYSTERQYLRIVRREGGLQTACARRLRDIGFCETPSPECGDIMTVMAPYAMQKGKIKCRPTGTICVSTTMRAVVTSDMGIVIAQSARLPMIQAWTFKDA